MSVEDKKGDKNEDKEKKSEQKSNISDGDIRQYMPLQRFGNKYDVSNTILYLASPLSSYMTGQTLLVDGGAFAIIPNWLPHYPDFLKKWTAKF